MDFTRCYGCMRELSPPGAVCPHCGYDNTNDPNDPKKQPSHVLPCGTVLNGKFIIGRTLGQGGFGITYIGYDLNLEIPVCIKEYYPEGSAMRSATQSRLVYWGTSENAQSMKDNRKGFVKEAQKAVKLRDLSHVVTVWDVFYENETAYIVMDYIEGETLKSRLVRTQKTLSEKECVMLLAPLLEDLEKAHKRGIIHRDIKPDNIMLTSDGEPVLLDMGAAKDLGKSGGGTRSSTTVVSQGFSPLEQYSGDSSKIKSWSDVYAMCATVYYCVSGRVPPTATDRVIGESVDFGVFTPAVAEVLKKGLAIKAEDRIQTMDELLHMLRHVKNSESIPNFQKQEARQPGIRENGEEERIEEEYQRAKNLMGMKGINSALEAAEGIFNALGQYKDSPSQVKECRRQLEQNRKQYTLTGIAEQEKPGLFGTNFELIERYEQELAKRRKEFDDLKYSLQFKRRTQVQQEIKWYEEELKRLKHLGTISGAEEEYNSVVQYSVLEITSFQRAADAGDAEAMTIIGFLYERGYGFKRDYAKAMEWYQKAADAGYAGAMNNIGILYEKAYGVEQDYTKAMAWYQKAVDAGSAVAMCNIGFLYENGYGVEQDYAKAIVWYQKAAAAGDVTAMQAIGYMYENGYGVTQDQTKADEWYQKAKDAGYTG